MAKFSVKKPFTVLVAVIIVVVLGFVSYSRMTPDLLPSINLPYVMVTTVYAGATPEEVEKTVTRPLEQAMATLEHIENITSTSSANYSTLILEFTEDADIDKLTVDILQDIQLVSGAWDESVGTPNILKINPDMLPVMVAAVDRDGMTTAELSRFVEDSLLPKLEGVEGVASVTASGLVTQSVGVTLDDKRMAKLNETLREKIDSQTQEAQKKLDDARAELEVSEQQLETGKTDLETGKEELANQTVLGGEEIENGKNQLYDTKLQLTVQIAELQNQLNELRSSRAQMAGIQDSLAVLHEQRDALQREADELNELAKQAQTLAEKQASVEAEIAAVRANASLSEEQKAQEIEKIQSREDVRQAAADFAALQAKLSARGLTAQTLVQAIGKQSAAVAAADGAIAQMSGTLSALGVTEASLPDAIGQLDASEAQLTQGLDALQSTLDGLNSGAAELAEAQAQLEKQKISGIFSLNEATAKLLDGEAQLQAAKAQLDEGLEALEEGKDAAYEASDLPSILTAEAVSSLLMAQNFDMPAGYAQEDGVRTLVSVGDKIESIDDLKNTVLIDLNIDGVDPILLSDVASVELVDDADEVYARINGSPGILLSMQKQSTYATAEVSDNLAKRFEELDGEFAGLHFTPLMDQGDYIYLVMNSIMENMLLSAVFSVLVLFLFLKDLKPTWMTLCSIPLSVLFAIVLMYFSGVTLNIISLSALTVSIGMLVDNSVVVIENIYRLRHLGLSAVKAAVSGATQVAGAVAASTLTTICVFLPIVFVEGLTRQLFTDMALTLGYALIASLIVSLTLVPAMSSRLLRKCKSPSHKWFDKMLSGYQRSLSWTLRHKATVLVVAVALLVLSAWGAFSRGFSYMPEMSTNQITVSVEMPRGTKEAETMTATDEVSARVQEIEGVQTVGAMLTGDTESMLYVMLNDGADSQAVAQQVNARCADMSAKVDAAGSGIDMSALSGAGVEIRLFGDDLQDLKEAADLVADKLSAVEGTAEVSNGIEETDRELHFTVDKIAAAENGLTTAQVYAEISKALQNEFSADTLPVNGENIDISVLSGDVPTPDELREYTFTVTDRSGTEREVKLSDVATVEEREAMQAVTRLNQRRMLTVTADVDAGHNVTLVTSAARKAMQDLALPEGITMEFAGENQAIMESVEQLVQMLLLGVLLVYLVMVAQFQSLKSPFIVMFTIPLAFTGGLLGLILTGKDVSIISLIGFIMLTGIVVNNGIVLVDYVNRLRLDGKEKREALVEAGSTRMRPILMTSVTTVLGLLVTALGGGTGGELMQPIAIVCIGGLIYATLMTLYVVPVMYDLMNRRDMKKIDEEDLVISQE